MSAVLTAVFHPNCATYEVLSARNGLLVDVISEKHLLFSYLNKKAECARDQYEVVSATFKAQ
jgi:hypothetical protein